MIDLKIKYHSDIDRLKIYDKGNWIDLRTADYVRLKKWEIALISLGISVKLPEGYEALITLRSSTPKRWGVIQINTPAVIDNSYCGDNDIWYLQVMAIRDTFIPKNIRIAQFRIIETMPQIRFVKVDTLGCKDRGGFGTTGEK